jgi:hypothetical protein
MMIFLPGRGESVCFETPLFRRESIQIEMLHYIVYHLNRFGQTDGVFMNPLKQDTGVPVYSTLDDFARLLGVEAEILQELIEGKEPFALKHPARTPRESIGYKTSQTKTRPSHSRTRR